MSMNESMFSEPLFGSCRCQRFDENVFPKIPDWKLEQCIPRRNASKDKKRYDDWQNYTQIILHLLICSGKNPVFFVDIIISTDL